MTNVTGYANMAQASQKQMVGSCRGMPIKPVHTVQAAATGS